MLNIFSLFKTHGGLGLEADLENKTGLTMQDVLSSSSYKQYTAALNGTCETSYSQQDLSAKTRLTMQNVLLPSKKHGTLHPEPNLPTETRLSSSGLVVFPNKKYTMGIDESSETHISEALPANAIHQSTQISTFESILNQSRLYKRYLDSSIDCLSMTTLNSEVTLSSGVTSAEASRTRSRSMRLEEISL